MQQAAKMRDKDIIEGDFVEMETTEVKPYNSDDMEKFYNKYWVPYIKTVNITKLNRGLLVEYANGSGAFYFRNYLNPGGVTANSYIIFVLNTSIAKMLKLMVPLSTGNIHLHYGMEVLFLLNLRMYHILENNYLIFVKMGKNITAHH